MASKEPYTPPAPSPIPLTVLIVGAGFAGLTAAIECHRHGLRPIVVDKFRALKPLGDIISFASNSSRIFERWPGVAEQMEPITLRPKDGFGIRASTTGETLLQQRWTDEQNSWGNRYDGHRGEYHTIVYRHAVEDLGIEVRLGASVADYFETDSDGDGGGSAGVILESGEKITADVVIAAEGVRSKGRTTVLGYDDRPKPSGYAVYRTWFETANTIATDPDLKWLVEGGDKHICWLAPDIHFIIAVLKNGQDISWVCTHKDTEDIDESWQLEAPLADARKVLAGWEPTIQKILDKTPEPLVDWKLVFRDPLEKWISPLRRIALIGDAAHPFLPTSIQGASQSMEDGATIAVCLRRACERAAAAAATTPQTNGDATTAAETRARAVKEATATFEALRYERVKSAQKTGTQTRDIWHKADFAAARKDPESLRLRREGWLLNFDAERYAEAWYDRTADAVRDKGVVEARQLHVPEGARFGFMEYET
ncbi:Salicylate hydroxylase [Apiospora kogelbergensis]|uniref:Salicylate hydroxylase n=1 Tax=Apiospora kogelbergensis TaxID=1337665 RepID=A0AAW0QIZ1_9PEZI